MKNISIETDLRSLEMVGSSNINADEGELYLPTLKVPENIMIKILTEDPKSDARFAFKYTEEFLRKHSDLKGIPWGFISNQYDFTEDFIREFKDKLDFERIENRIDNLCDMEMYDEDHVEEVLSEDFVKEFSNKFSKYFVSWYIE